MCIRDRTYLEQRDMKALLAAMAPGVTWIGSGRGEVCRGKQEARRLLEQDLAEYGGAFSITERWQEAEPLPGEGWLIYGGFRAEPGDPSAGLAELDPVSYTHLDVYKRQRWGRARRWRWSTGTRPPWTAAASAGPWS